MVVVDTNLLIRLATCDVAADRDAVARLIEKHEIRIAKTILLEAEWVLRSRYAYSSAQVLAFFEYLAGLASVYLEDEDAVRWALGAAATDIDFADAMHLSAAATTGEHFYTFDKALHRKASRLEGASVRLLR
jgi:predicted nucleic-acid-binding protein